MVVEVERLDDSCTRPEGGARDLSGERCVLHQAEYHDELTRLNVGSDPDSELGHAGQPA